MAVDKINKSDNTKYKIVKYLGSNEVTTVPESWLGKSKIKEGDVDREVDTRAWPKGENSYSITKLVTNKSAKKNKWPMLPVEILGTASKCTRFSICFGRRMSSAYVTVLLYNPIGIKQISTLTDFLYIQKLIT